MNLTDFINSSESASPHFVLLGHPVEHSWSPLMHNTALQHYGIDARYYAVDVRQQELSSLAAYLNKDSLLGANITIPYKQVIMDYLDDIAPQARDMGAVNTLVKNGFRLEGYNTDIDGFIAPLEDYGYELEGGRALVFGTGGASRAIVFGLKELTMEEIMLVSRSPARRSLFDEDNRVKIISYDEWTAYSDEASLIVNATPLGMYPKTGQSPVRDTEKQFLADAICYDIVYNPAETKFLRQAESVGSTTIGGLEMLIQQGSCSFEYWNGQPFPINIVRNALHEKLEN